MRRWKIGIRPQLIILVCFSSLFSLLILALVTTVYFSSSLSNSRAERLEVIAELKATQVKQALQYTYYQIYWLTNRDAISTALSSYRAGNNSRSVFADAQITLDQLLTSSELFAGARLYNLDLDVVAESYNNVTAISTPTMDALYPIAKNATIPSQLSNASPSSPAFYTGPLGNNSDYFTTYFMGITVPVFANTSIIFPEPTIAGYLSILASAENIRSAINDTSSMSTNSSSGQTDDYKVIAVRPTYNSRFSTRTANFSAIDGYEAVFPVDHDYGPQYRYTIGTSSAVKEAFSKDAGSSTKVRNILHKKVAIGFNQIELNPSTMWAIIIEQSHSQFYAPVHKLINIIVGVVIGTGVFMCLLTFPLAVFFIRPITKLKAATESIAKSKRKCEQNNHSALSTASQGSVKSYSESQARKTRGERDLNGLNKRNSVNSVSTGTTLSAHSTAIRLPGKIRNSKKLFKDELTELTEAFNIMTDELDKQYTHLEDRVKSRTKELEASKIEAEAANEAKTVFIANISHELRTPLNGILGMTAIAMEESDHSRIQDSLELIHRSGELLLHILTELLTYSKNTLNRSKLEKSNFQILEIVYQVKSIFTKLALDQRVNFKILIKPNVIRKLVLYGDSNRIIQIVMNLVSNSLKFTPVDGSVGVTFKLLGEYDFQKSAEENFTKVHILPKCGLKKESPTSSNGESTLFNKSNASERHAIKSRSNSLAQDQSEFSDTSGELFEKTPKSKKKVDTELDNDNISVVTLSTAEYENNIFQSQFNQMKPLPKTPSRVNSIHSIGSIRHKGTSSVISRKSMDEKSIDEEHKSSSSESSITNEKIHDSSSESKENNLLPPHAETGEHNTSSIANTTAGTFVDNGKRNSIISNLGSNEMVKNHKTYRIRNMYKPKTWAIQIEVTDTGPGIEPALQEKVFEPFIQGDQTLSRSYGGTGLGLSICRQLATMMRGTLTLKSSVGQGSTFTFTVPLPQTGEIVVPEEDMEEFCNDEYNANARVNRKVVFENTEISEYETPEEKVDSSYEKPEVRVAESGEESPKSSDKSKDARSIDDQTSTISGTGTGKRKHSFKIEIPSRTQLLEKPQLIARSSTGTANSSDRNDSSRNLLDDLSDLHILVAEDNMVNQEVIKRMLNLEGFHNVTMACNGAEAVELLKQSIDNQHPYDLILMDVQMPKIDGLLATKMIRNNLNYDRPIIALTAFADESNVKECLNSGMSGFLAKPIRRANLRKTIVKFSPVLLSEVVTTPQTFNGDEKRLQ